MSDKDDLLDDGRLLKAELTATTEIDQQLDEKQRELDVVSGLNRTCIEENSSQTLDQETYQRRYDGYVDQYTQFKAAYDELEAEKQKRTDKGMVLGGFLFVIRELDELPMEFSEELWNAVIDRVTVNNDGSLVFTFRNGSNVEIDT